MSEGTPQERADKRFRLRELDEQTDALDHQLDEAEARVRELTLQEQRRRALDEVVA